LLATTTSTANSGLLYEILPYFEEKYNVLVKVIPVGTGQALELGRRGDVDIIIVHAPLKEKEFIEKGYGTERYNIFYNYFVIVGPPSDPAGIKEAKDAPHALKKIFDNRSKFVSRGDDSGTHTKEKELWKSLGLNYELEVDTIENEWYLSVNAGMGDTLVRANEMRAYTLTDEGTFWAFDNLELEILFRDDTNLRNQYSIIPINPQRFPHVNHDLAMKLVSWMLSKETKLKIANFKKDGHTLFYTEG
jgi:tungstate transport system substrate-binding protein